MNAVDVLSPPPPPESRLLVGGAVLVGGQLSPVFIPLVTSSGLSTGLKSALAERLYQGMVGAWKATQRVPLTQAQFRLEYVRLEPRDDPGFTEADLIRKLTAGTSAFQHCLAALGLSWRQRTEAGYRIEIPCLDFGVAQWLLLPGESYVEFQLAAQRMRPDSFVLVAGYGEGATGYIPTDRHMAEGDGNLRDWSWVAAGSERRLRKAIRAVLGVPEAASAQAPWRENLPIVLVQKELYLKHPAARVAARAALQYVGPNQELREVQSIQRVSDVGEQIQARRSLLKSMKPRRLSSEIPSQPSTIASQVTATFNSRIFRFWKTAARTSSSFT